MADNKTAEGKSNTGTAKTGTDSLRDRRDAAFERARSAVEGLEANPVGVLVGGLAVGLLAGAVVPRGDRERTALRGLGRRLAEGVVAAATAAKATGKEQIDAKLMSRDTAKESARKVLESALSAAKTGSASDAIAKADEAKAEREDAKSDDRDDTGSSTTATGTGGGTSTAAGGTSAYQSGGTQA